MVIAGLLVLNATLSLFQESRAQKALALLRQQLRVMALVRRDGVWADVPAEELMPGDVVHLRQGIIVPADVKVQEGALLVDQSALTGESAALLAVPARRFPHGQLRLRAGCHGVPGADGGPDARPSRIVAVGTGGRGSFLLCRSRLGQGVAFRTTRPAMSETGWSEQTVEPAVRGPGEREVITAWQKTASLAFAHEARCPGCRRTSAVTDHAMNWPAKS
jgi:hypothetical protein